MVSYFGFMVAYIIISSTAVIQFVQNIIHYTLNSYAVKAVISICLIFPLCLLKSLKQLSKVASIAGIFIFVTGFTIIVYFFIHVKSGVICETDDGPINYDLPTWPKASAGKSFLYFLMYLPALQGYFSAHTVLPTLNMELQGPPLLRKRVTRISLYIAIALASFFYLASGFMGAAMFGSQTQDNILKNFTPCGWIWPDIVSIVYAVVVIIAFPLVLYPIKISILGMAHIELGSKKAFKVMCLISLCFVLATMGISMLFEQIVVIFGLFASATGIIIYFTMPIFMFLRYPKVKAEHPEMDKLPDGDVVVDPVIVGVLSMAAPVVNSHTVGRIRAMSNKIFGPQQPMPADRSRSNSKTGRPNRSLSFFRPRAISIENSAGVAKIRTGSMIAMKSPVLDQENDDADTQVQAGPVTNIVDSSDDQKDGLMDTQQSKNEGTRLVEQPTAEVTQSEEDQKSDNADTVLEEIHLPPPSQYSGVISTKRKVFAYTALTIMICICIEGFVMNLIDVIDVFKK